MDEELKARLDRLEAYMHFVASGLCVLDVKFIYLIDGNKTIDVEEKLAAELEGISELVAEQQKKLFG